MSEIVAKITIKVHLVNGKEITHTYDPPTSTAKLNEFIREMVDRRMGALVRGESRYLYFENPNITYNPDNVVGVEFSTIGAEELKKALERAQRRAGLVREQH